MGGTYDHGYGQEWTQSLVYRREGYTSSVADYHKHEYYELNLIFSGNIRILLPDQSVETERSQLVLTAPGTSHFISCLPDKLYSRLYLCFSPELVEGQLPEWERMRQVFGENGRILSVNKEQRELYRQIIDAIHEETSALRKRLLIGYLLSHIADDAQKGAAETTPPPSYVIEALSYIDQHFHEKIVAAELAKKLHIGRTTLMTGFRKYTGTSLNAYLVSLRVKTAAKQLKEGRSVQETAENCGFADAGGLIRSFKQVYGITPGKYIQMERQ